MNSFRFLERGIRAEIARQEALLRAGEQVVQETLHFDPRTERDHVAALQGGGARLPLLPRARPRPGRDHRGDARPRARRRCPSCRPRAPSASSATSASAPRQRALLAFRAELGDFFEAALRRRTAPSRSRWPTGSQRARRAHRRRRSRPLAVAPSALASSSRWSPRRRSRRNAQAGARHARRRGRRPGADRRGRGPGRHGGGGDELDADRRARSPPTPTPPRRSSGGNMKAIGAIIGSRHARDQGPRRRRRGHAHRAREARALTAARCERSRR